MTQSTAAAHWDAMYVSATRSAWTQNPLVAQEVYTRMTGQTGFWLEWLFTQKLAPVGRLLAVGCGDGGHELAIARRGFASEVVAFDASPVAIQLAQASAQAEGLSVDFSVRLFEEFIAQPGHANTFDAVLFSGSLHHVTDLEGMLSAVRQVLRPGGTVIVNEYVGACYQLYPRSQVDIVNRVLGRIPETFRMSSNEKLQLPTMDMIIANDPSEGVRAPLIPVLLPMYFQSTYERFVGGALLHPLFGHLNGSKVNDGSPESNALVSMLIALENELTAAGNLPHDFMFGLYQKS
ncbi:class I SAM-dependent methyltransferase [Brevundimonas phoenicis]|uniref:class I SAM-dependent methyltransferase n=1 Tax=unclassified Brevundimonas TaxID=2622653 RepID=UPI0039A22FEF